MFVDLTGEWWNVDHIIKIEPFHPPGVKPLQPTGIVYVVTLSNGDQRGITKEEFTKIMNISK